MRVFLTGATGFLGRHLTRALVERRHEVHALRRRTSDLTALGALADRVIFHEAERADLTRLFSALPTPDAVVHLATCYGRHKEKDAEVAEVNTLFPLALLEAAAARCVRTFVNADTCINEWPIRYEYLRSYALSKRHFAQWGEVFASQDRIRFVNLRLHHPYGPGDCASKFVPFIIRECLRSAGVIPLTSGAQKKDFIYVDDVIAAFLTVLEKAERLPESHAVLECGSGVAISVRQLVETVHRLTGSRAQLGFGALPSRENEPSFLRADTSALTSIGWAPEYTLEQGIWKTLSLEYGCNVEKRAVATC